jgi:hypothetical protein
MARTRFHAILEERVTEEVNKLSESLAIGHSSSYENYRENVGFIRGMKAVLTLCSEIETEFD